MFSKKIATFPRRGPGNNCKTLKTCLWVFQGKEQERKEKGKKEMKKNDEKEGSRMWIEIVERQLVVKESKKVGRNEEIIYSWIVH